MIQIKRFDIGRTDSFAPTVHDGLTVVSDLPYLTAKMSGGKAQIAGCVTAGRNSILEQRRKILISTGLQPGDDGRKTSGSRFNGFGVQGNPLKRVLSL
jgi:hypothetical protein